MNALRIKITLLVTGAIVAMSAIGVAAAASVSALMRTPTTTVFFRYGGDAMEIAPGAAVLPQALHAASGGVETVVAAYALLIVTCAAAVGVIVANMVVRPLSILEEAVNSVDPEGFLPKLDESGLGETLETARLINRLSERLRTAMQGRMRLVAAAGHDLRTPLTRMKLRLEFMEDETMRAKWLRDVEEMEHIADSAIRLVREEAETEETTPVLLSDLVRDLCDELTEMGHHVTCSAEDDVTVRGGANSLKRAISNLALNAILHGEATAEAPAEIALSRSGASATLTVSDHGPGIPEEAIARAFEPFFRADPARRKDGNGAGLGLAIAREIVHRHGGSVTLANRKGGGLLQTVTIPLA